MIPFLLACAPPLAPMRKYGNPAQLALVGGDYVMVSRDGVDAQVFDNANGANGTDQITLYDESWGASVNLNQFKILVSENDDMVRAVRPYGVTGSIAIPDDGFVVAVNGTSLPYLNGLAPEDVLWIRPTDVCGPRTDGVPVAMFHDLGATSEDFEATLQDIEAEGYTTLTQAELADFLDGGCSSQLPENPLFLSFDDAYISHFDYAPALLDAYGMVGTVFVITSYPGSVSWVASWLSIEDAVAEYPDAVELGCHSHNAHTNPGGVAKYLSMTEAERAADLAACRDALESHTGITPTVIAWPFGVYDDELLEDARDAGFMMAMSTWPGLNVPDNSDALGHVRRFGANVTTGWAATESTINRWHVCGDD